MKLFRLVGSAAALHLGSEPLTFLCVALLWRRDQNIVCVCKKKKSVILVRNALTPPPPLLTLPPLPENWQYIQTECADGWWPHNGFCYKLLSAEEAGSWEESGQACGSLGANLTSLHSLSEVEMLLKLLANCEERHIISTSVYHTHTHSWGYYPGRY